MIVCVVGNLAARYREMLAASATNTDGLAHGGWVFFMRTGSKHNLGGALTGKPTTSYRAEVRAILEVIWRTEHPTCIVMDCHSAYRILCDVLGQCERGETATWPEDDGCHDYWETIVEIMLKRNTNIVVKWMPCHLDEPEKQKAMQAFFDEGGCEAWILGNCGADEMAKQGAKLAAPPDHLLSRERFTRILTRTVQRMAVHIWAAEKGIIDEKTVDGHEACLEDNIFGINDLENYDDEGDVYIDAFNDLMTATEPDVDDHSDWLHDTVGQMGGSAGDMQCSVPTRGCCATSTAQGDGGHNPCPEKESVHKQ